MLKPKVMSLFSGCGGTCLAFKNAGYEIAVANEIDKHAIKTYKANFDNKLIEGCIKENIEELKSYKDIDVIVAGFPCQSFSVAGTRKGMKDDRGKLINSVFEIIDSVHPKFIMLENVKGLLSSNKGKDFQYILDSLNSLGYKVTYKVINAYEERYTRQIRERLYIIASKKDKIYLDKIILNIYEKRFFPIRNSNYLSFFDTDIPELEYTKEKHPQYFTNKINLSDICNPGFYQIRMGSYIRGNVNCPTLTANMGTGGHNVPIIKTSSGKIRKLSPRECFNLMTFPEDFDISKCSNSQLYKQAGNSVIVDLVCDIAKEIIKFI